MSSMEFPGESETQYPYKCSSDDTVISETELQDGIPGDEVDSSLRTQATTVRTTSSLWPMSRRQSTTFRFISDPRLYRIPDENPACADTYSLDSNAADADGEEGTITSPTQPLYGDGVYMVHGVRVDMSTILPLAHKVLLNLFLSDPERSVPSHDDNWSWAFVALNKGIDVAYPADGGIPSFSSLYGSIVGNFSCRWC